MFYQQVFAKKQALTLHYVGSVLISGGQTYGTRGRGWRPVHDKRPAFFTLLLLLLCQYQIVQTFIQFRKSVEVLLLVIFLVRILVFSAARCQESIAIFSVTSVLHKIPS